ncbi:MAG: T9SS type A sorting domain-containing protein [Bacteroidetes bacterium]|nr:T9SS type A sorting domain-containing protein [Bacteroidota bacterium]MCH8525212.1 T9SS type A sorting domain-containing protein [Balneolales bacterium]
MTSLKRTSLLLAMIVAFTSIHNSNLYAQYYDLSVGTERHFYNCYGVTSNCDLPLPGEQTVGLERVTDEITVDGKQWAVVTFMLWPDFFEKKPSYFVEENASITENLYRMEGSVLIEFVDGNEVPIFDFEIDPNQPLSEHFAPFPRANPFDPTPYNAENLGRDFELSSQVLLDTTIAFPDMSQRRIIWADNPLEPGFDVPEHLIGTVFVNEILFEDMGTLKIRQTSNYTPYQPYFYVQDTGVMFTPINHRGYIMVGYTSSDGKSIGWQVPVPSSIDFGGSEHPDKAELHQNYPNPFNPTTQIRFSLPMESAVELDVYTVTGRHVANLVNEVRPAGTHQVTFDASDLASGVYMYRIRAGNFIENRKLTLIR